MLEFIALIKSIAALLGIGNVDIFIEITVSNSVVFLGNTESSPRTLQFCSQLQRNK